MAETDVHLDEMVDTIDALKDRYRDASDTYVAGNLFIYYQEGNPAARFAPDVFVVFGVPKKKRRIYKLWEEKRAPAFVLELTSRATRREDRGPKKEFCAKLGVQEYFMFDPEADYLKPPLQGFRLAKGRYEPIPADANGGLRSEALGLMLTREGMRLRLVDLATGQPLLRPDEVRLARREAQAQVAAAEMRAEAAEAELARLRALLEKKKGARSAR